LPGRFYKGLRREIIDLVRLDIAYDADQARQVREIAVDKVQIVEDSELTKARIVHLGGAGAPDEAVDVVTPVEQEPGQISAVLPRSSGDKCFLRHRQPARCPPTMFRP
jgi:hypothetical protein